jgi:AcrR family transcriptional regulator
MEGLDCRKKLIAAATPIFARKGLHGTNVRDLARAAGVNFSMISYHFGGKNGLYAAVLEEQFASLRHVAWVAGMAIPSWEKFKTYIYQCGICFHEGGKGEFTPFTAGADHGVPECPLCLNNDGALFTEIAVEEPEQAEPLRRRRRRASRKAAEVVHG